MTIELNEQESRLVKETLETVLEEENVLSTFYKIVALQVIDKINENTL